MNAGTPTVIVPRRAPNPLTAGGWSGLSFVAANILNTLIYFPLARRLGPEEFGLYAQANLLYGALTLLAEGSVIRTLVQMRGERATLSRGGLWLSAALGLAGLVICAAAAPLMVRLYNNPDVRPLLLWLAPSVLIAALGATPHALLQRELDFRRKTLPETLAIGAGGMAALGAAFAGLGAYSLVALTMTAASVSTVTAWWVCRERPTPAPPGWPLLRRMARFTGSLGAADLALYLRLNTDYALTGRILGAAPLGIYTVAWATSAGPLLFITAFTGRVGFAVYARLQGEGERLREVFLSALRIVATAAVPVFLGAVVIAPDLVPVALGSRWEAAAGPVVPLFLLQMVRTVCGPGALADPGDRAQPRCT
ncbi:MAG: oligosaccharide flippase family protein [Dehalococcoidia bacterium]